MDTNVREELGKKDATITKGSSLQEVILRSFTLAKDSSNNESFSGIADIERMITSLLNQRPVLWVDIHTGLGPYGSYVLIADEEPQESILSSNALPISGQPANNHKKLASFQAFRSNTIALFEDKIVTHGSATNEGQSEGYDHLMGSLTGEQLCPEPICKSFVQEFGARPGLLTAWALTVDNRDYWTRREYWAKQNKFGGSFVRWAFDPQRKSWREKVIQGGREVWEKALLGL